MTQFDSLQAGSAVTSVTAATLGHVAPHPLQYVVWIVAIIAGIYSIYRGWSADRRAYNAERNDRQIQ